MIEKIVLRDHVKAIIKSSKLLKPGIYFFTPNDFSKQQAYMDHPKEYMIDPYFYNSVARNTE